MCGRFYIDLETAKDIEEIVRQAEEKLRNEQLAADVRISNNLIKKVVEKGDVHPSESVCILTGEDRQSDMTLKICEWGFPHYNKKGVIFNARSESVMEKRMFKDSVLERRCIVPAKGFYEWDKSKNKIFFKRPDGHTMYMAGVYKTFQDMQRFVILTTGANDSMREIHNRMPLILEQRQLEQWLYDAALTEPILQQTPLQLEKEAEYMQQTFFL